MSGPKERQTGGRGASTQDFDEKTAAPSKPRDGMARQTARQLKTRWGLQLVVDWKTVETVFVWRHGEGVREAWSRESGTGDDAVFTLTESRGVE